MSSKLDFSSLDINPRILDGVRRAKLKNMVQVLTLSTNELVCSTRLSASDVGLLQNSVANAFYVSLPVTALQIFYGNCQNHLSHQFLSTGCNIIDGLLKEGIMTGVLTEVSGESATGKTQLCLQMCLTVQLSRDWGGLGGAAVYIGTEDAFPSGRISDMATRLKQKFQEFEGMNFMDNVFVERASDFEELQFCLDQKIPLLASEKNVKLVVLDSVAAIARAEEQKFRSIVARNKRLCLVTNKLREVTQKHNIPIVVVNQVADDFLASFAGGCMTKKLPALGMSWASMMNVRIFLSRTSDHVKIRRTLGGEQKQIEVNIRTMEVLSAPHLPNVSCRFIVDEEGVKGLKTAQCGDDAK